jgi:hypothetical protein
MFLKVPRFFERRRNLLNEIFEKRAGLRKIIMSTIGITYKVRTTMFGEIVSWRHVFIIHL